MIATMRPTVTAKKKKEKTKVSDTNVTWRLESVLHYLSKGT